MRVKRAIKTHLNCQIEARPGADVMTGSQIRGNCDPGPGCAAWSESEGGREDGGNIYC